jgi:hypothetical protein
MDSPLLRGHATSLQRVRRDRTRSQRDNVALLGGVRMEARTAWFRETGEARLKEQLLIETMFCVYYLSKGRRCFGNARTSASTHFLLIFTLPEARWVDIEFA